MCSRKVAYSFFASAFMTAAGDHMVFTLCGVPCGVPNGRRFSANDDHSGGVVVE